MKLLNHLRYVPKHFAAVLAVTLAVATTVGVMAWGPDRKTFTIEKPATYVTFNSITNNPVDGDERNFSRAKAGNGSWTDAVTVKPGETYKIRMVVHNNAADTLNLTAKNTRASASVPTTTGKKVTVSNFVSADNAKPGRVWDDVMFTSDQNFNLAYVAGSARIYNSGYAAGGQGKPLPDSIVTSAGAKLGYAEAGDGKIPGCFKYLSYVEYTVKPQFAEEASFDVAKTVSKHGKNTWAESVAVKPGDTVDFRIKYQNTGTSQQDNVGVKDRLPSQLRYVDGSTKLYNNQNPNGKQLSDNLTTNGINIGSHGAGGQSFIVFSAKVADAKTIPCGTHRLINTATVTSADQSKSDDASVTTSKICETSAPAPTETTETPQTPEVKGAASPESIASTGPAAMLGGLFGSSALGYGAYSYFQSRRDLIARLRGR